MTLPVRPPLVGITLIVIAIILHYTYPIKTLLTFPSNLTGVLLGLLGLLIMVWGRNTFQKQGVLLRPGSKSRTIVKNGPFTFTRNPMYLGMITTLLGVSIILGSLISLIAPAIMFLVLNFYHIPFEERLMKKTFGKKYLEYKKKVRRWI